MPSLPRPLAIALAVLVASAAAFAAGNPLVVTSRLVDVPNPGLVDRSPADGAPDGWIPAPETGGFRVDPATGRSGGPAARVSWTPGTKGRLCTASTPITGGRTVRARTWVRGEAGLPDVVGFHLVLSGDKGPLDTGKRRVDAGSTGWEEVDILTTASAAATRAQVCLDVRMAADGAGALIVEPLRVEEVDARSTTAALPVKRILLVTVETFNRDHVSAYGYPRATTPNLDRLIREGTSFDAHYAAAPYTHPSLASILTGLLPTALGFTSNVPTVPTNVATLPERLADAGYVAAGFSSQYVLSNRWGLNRGFHYWRNQANDVPAGRVNDELLAWWDTHPDDNSFVWAHHFDPHGPYRPPQGWREKFVNDALWAADSMRLDPSTKAEGVPFIPNYVYDKDQRDRRWYVAGYDGDIAYWDSQLGRLIKAIHDRGWERDTVVLVTADHGESMTEHARFFCHGSLWEHDIHVPMVIWGPGRVPAGKVVSTATGHTQILPTLLDLAGVGSKRGSMLAPDPEHLAVAVHGKGDKLRWAVRGENSWKLIFDATGSLVDAYELGKDPGETVNRAGLLPPEARAITTRFKKALEGPVGVVNTRPEPTLDAEDLERLRALGYIE